MLTPQAGRRRRHAQLLEAGHVLGDDAERNEIAPRCRKALTRKRQTLSRVGDIEVAAVVNWRSRFGAICVTISSAPSRSWSPSSGQPRLVRLSRRSRSIGGGLSSFRWMSLAPSSTAIGGWQ